MRRPRQRPLGRRPAGDGARAVALAGAAAAGACAVVGLLRWRLWSGDVPETSSAPRAEYFDDAELARNRAYRRGVWAMAAVGVPLGAGTVVAVALLGGRWRPLVVRAARARPWRAGAMVGAGLAATSVAAGLPLGVARYAWGRRYGIVTQSLRGWLADQGKGLGLGVAVGAVAGAAAATGMARMPRLWWLAGAGGAAASSVAASVLSPVLVEPLFQKTRALDDDALRSQILDLARRAGVRADDVKVNDASTRTTAANAYVSGLGRTRHVVLFDTLLRDFPRDQVRFVVAHELAHVERRHVLKGTAWGAALAVPAALLAFAVVGWRTGFGPPGRGAAGADLVVRRFAVAAATAAVVGTVAAPLGAWVSRAYEREAEWRALQLARDPRAAIGLQQGLVRGSLGVPDPPRAVQLWFGSHPTALERIGMALRAAREG